MSSLEIQYYTLCHGKWGGVDVVGWFKYPDRSVLSGQMGKTFLDNFRDEAAAQAVYPQLKGWSSAWTEPQVSLSHLPSEDDPVPGGMYPDDYDDCREC